MGEHVPAWMCVWIPLDLLTAHLASRCLCCFRALLVCSCGHFLPVTRILEASFLARMLFNLRWVMSCRTHSKLKIKWKVHQFHKCTEPHSFATQPLQSHAWPGPVATAQYWEGDFPPSLLQRKAPHWTFQVCRLLSACVSSSCHWDSCNIPPVLILLTEPCTSWEVGLVQAAHPAVPAAFWAQSSGSYLSEENDRAHFCGFDILCFEIYLVIVIAAWSIRVLRSW